MNLSTRSLVFGVVFLAILWPPGEACASLLGWDAHETASRLLLPSDYLVGDHCARPLGPFDPFWWSYPSVHQENKKRGNKHFERREPVWLVMSQWTEMHEEGYVAEPRSGAAPAASSGGGGGGSRYRHWERLSSSLTPTTDQVLSYDYPTTIPASTDGYAASTSKVATPLPPSVLLVGSGLTGLLALGRRRPFRLNC